MTPSTLAGRRIMIVEDEMVVAMLLEDMLGDLGCEAVTLAGRPAQAIALIEANPLDAAILDVNLDGQDSYPVADALSERGVPFIFSTGYSGISLKEGYRGRPMLQKPFTSQELGEALARLLAGERNA